jgi:hypothetical protein
MKVVPPSLDNVAGESSDDRARPLEEDRLQVNAQNHAVRG